MLQVIMDPHGTAGFLYPFLPKTAHRAVFFVSRHDGRYAAFGMACDMGRIISLSLTSILPGIVLKYQSYTKSPQGASQ